MNDTGIIAVERLQARIRMLERENTDHRQTIRKMNNTIGEQSRTINALNNKVIKSLKEGKILLNKDVLTFRQAFMQRCAEKQIISYLSDFLGFNPTWDNLTTERLSAFQIWLKNAPKRKGDGVISDSSAALYIVKLKNVIKFGYQNRNDTSSALKIERVASAKKVWLRPNDLQAVLSYSTDNIAERVARRIFLISAITGARKSDAEQLTASNIDGNTLRYIPIKTHAKECFVALTGEAKSVLTNLLSERIEYKGDLNAPLKEVLNKCGLDRTFDIGTPGKENVVPLHNAVTMHTARHTFATLKFRYSNWTERQIADAIGHTSFNQTFERYVIDKSPVSDAEKMENKDAIFC